MTNNDILRRLRYTFDFSDNQMISIFEHCDYTVSRQQIIDWLKKEDDPDYQESSDEILAFFLNGLITEKRGKKEGVKPKTEKLLTNNMIFMKLKIALNLKAEDVISILDSVDFEISKHELSAIFRKKGHKNFRKCNDQLLRNFLHGIQVKFRE